jgi:vacuolar-type H+-ATPase subunit I/STV1
MPTEHEEALWLHAERTISMVELAEFSGLAESVLQELVEYGALRPADPERRVFGGDCVTPLRAAARLQSDLELETPALALALSFLERIRSLEAEVRHLDAQLARPRR